MQGKTLDLQRNHRRDPVKVENLRTLSCPVCDKQIDDLVGLNIHLDEEHNFENVTSSKGGSSIRSLKGKKINYEVVGKKRDNNDSSSFKIDTSFWKAGVVGKSKCHKCQRILDGRTGSINCRKCGELFCLKHCRNAIKLNADAHYDPYNGVWCKCCNECFKSKEGYNEYGYFVEKTFEYFKIRDNKNEDIKLIVLQLESRLVRLINGIYELYINHNRGMISSLKLASAVQELEQRIVPWKSNSSSSKCNICKNAFGIFQRKHHCRICGEIVCETESRRCSSEIPVSSLVSAAQDLPFSNLVISNISLDIEISTRICSKCLRTIFASRKLKFEISKSLSPLLLEYEQLHRLESSILSLIPRFETCLKENTELNFIDPLKISNLTNVRKSLLQKCSLYDKSYKEVLKMEPTIKAEQCIKISIAAHASSFIETKILPLKRIPEILDPKIDEIPLAKPSDLLFNNLTIAEVKKYREELMVIKEQKFLVQEMLMKSIKDRNFEEAAILKRNLDEIDTNIEDLESKLGDEGFE